MQAFFRRMHMRMTQLDMSQRDVAKAVDRSPSAVSAWFRTGALPDGEAMLKLPNVLKCSPSWLLLGEGPIALAGREPGRELALRQEGAATAINEMRAELDLIEQRLVRQTGLSAKEAASLVETAFPAKRRKQGRG